ALKTSGTASLKKNPRSKKPWETTVKFGCHRTPNRFAVKNSTARNKNHTEGIWTQQRLVH
ncbi:hypothetical protein L8R07_22940, partial [Enterobacter roggenkampii]|uniref:hypothetical protein n=1 Tax=Enterobacter roggenkampii TaxID=1812935 RepID=UPI0020047905